MSFTISLYNNYRTRFDGDYSHGIFLQGKISVKTEQKKDEIVRKFNEEREIQLYENIGKYIENNLSEIKTIIKFPEDEFIKTDEGFKTRKGNDLEDYQYFYWLSIEVDV